MAGTVVVGIDTVGDDGEDDVEDEDDGCDPEPCTEGEVLEDRFVDISKDGQQEHGGDVGEGVPSGGQTGQEGYYPLNNLECDCDNQGAYEKVVGGEAVGIDVLRLGKDVALQEVEVAEGEKHRQDATGITDDSCGFLSM